MHKTEFSKRAALVRMRVEDVLQSTNCARQLEQHTTAWKLRNELVELQLIAKYETRRTMPSQQVRHLIKISMDVLTIERYLRKLNTPPCD